MRSDVRDLLALLERVGESHAIDLLPAELDDACREAERNKLVRRQSGSWGDSDYVVLTAEGREALRAAG